MLSAIDKTAKNNSLIIESMSNNLSLESHRESHRSDSHPMSYGFDSNSRKSDTLDNLTLAHVVQNPCGRHLTCPLLSDQTMIRSLLTSE